MADTDQYNVLRDGVKMWNKWRDLHPEAVIDLSGADLSNTKGNRANFTGADLTNANLSESQFGSARFSDANLTDVNLSQSDLEGADFEGATLEGTDLQGSQLVNATGLTQAQIDVAGGNQRTGLPVHLRSPAGWTSREAGD